MILLKQALLDYLAKDQRFHTWVAIWSAVVIALLVFLLFYIRSRNRKIFGLEGDVDSAVRLNRSFYNELIGWRSTFGPFYSLFQNSPESQPGHNHSEHTVAIDLDGVILEYVSPWNGVYHFGNIMPGAIEAMEKIRNLGFKIAVYTSRNNGMAAHNWGLDILHLTSLVQRELDKHGAPYDFISLFKPLAKYYIDDRAIPFSSWAQAMQAFLYNERRNLEGKIDRLYDEVNR